MLSGTHPKLTGSQGGLLPEAETIRKALEVTTEILERVHVNFVGIRIPLGLQGASSPFLRSSAGDVAGVGGA